MDPKTGITNTFNLVADGYDNPMMRFFPLAADQLAERLKLKPGEHVLDIATGTGAFATAAGQRIQPNGRVQAIDLSEGMMKNAKAKAAKVALDNIDFHIMDADKLEFKSNNFDAIGCSFGLFFLADMAKALTSWRSVLKPGGRLMFTSFAPSAFHPMTDLFFEDLQAVGFELPKDQPLRPADRLPSPEFCKSLLNDSGFTDTDSQSKQLGFHFGDAKDWWEILWNAGFRGYLEKMEADQLLEFKKIHLPRVAKLKKDDGIWLDVEVWFSGGVKQDAD